MPVLANRMSPPKFQIRRLVKNPDLIAVALVTLALCVSMNLAIFAVINSVLLCDLPFPTPDLLVTVFNTHPKTGVEQDRADNPKI
jgi:putative ABC transport system permease protein